MSTICIADVDGVFTTLLAQPNKQAIELAAQLGSKWAFAFVTGRSATWMQENIIPALESLYQQYPPKFSLVGAEYGAVLLQMGADQRWRKEITCAPIDAQLRFQVKKHIAGIRGVFFDDSKEVMVSVEAEHSLRSTEPEVVEAGIDAAEQYLQGVADQHADILEFHRTTYACDLTPTGLSKAYGTRTVLKHLGCKPELIHLFGDAPSDLLLADPAIEHRIRYLMHYVGDPEKISVEQQQKYKFVHYTHKKYDEGAIEALGQLLL